MPGFVRWIETAAGKVPVIAPAYTFRDRIGSWKARWGIGRMSYLVPPGLYAFGDPGPDAPVLVTANYKMSYDHVRREMAGRSLWLLVLETYGINVWCAAGKGTFGTGELVRRIRKASLEKVTRSRELIVPFLGAAGISAPEVKRRTGFTVGFSVIRASDLPGYLDRNMVATPEMQKLTFTQGERIILIPVEVISACKGMLLVMIPLLLLEVIFGHGLAAASLLPSLGALSAALAGAVATPAFLPTLPTRSFAIKGAFAGLFLAMLLHVWRGEGWNNAMTLGTFLVFPAISAFYGLNFTGSTPYTSRSGVKREMRLGLPMMAVAFLAGSVSWIYGRFFS